MNESYQAKYKDQWGEETTTLHNDGILLSLAVLEVTFAGRNFDSLECQLPQNSPQLAAFNLHEGDLVDCDIEYDMPL